MTQMTDSLAAHGIEVPFPQRDLHVRSLLGLEPDALRAWLEARGGELR